MLHGTNLAGIPLPGWAQAARARGAAAGAAHGLGDGLSHSRNGVLWRHDGLDARAGHGSGAMGLRRATCHTRRHLIGQRDGAKGPHHLAICIGQVPRGQHLAVFGQFRQGVLGHIDDLHRPHQYPDHLISLPRSVEQLDDSPLLALDALQPLDEIHTGRDELLMQMDPAMFALRGGEPCLVEVPTRAREDEAGLHHALHLLEALRSTRGAPESVPTLASHDPVVFLDHHGLLIIGLVEAEDAIHGGSQY
mmetsp:Transcript_59019/g.169461  ORF Transcript_59019/g.169461 Transcript_59019/m.169461 type:complete len:249 (+) Transcript_59019:241-987(+)